MPTADPAPPPCAPKQHSFFLLTSLNIFENIHIPPNGTSAAVQHWVGFVAGRARQQLDNSHHSEALHSYDTHCFFAVFFYIDFFPFLVYIYLRMHGFILIDKPEGWTSHDIVGYMRKVTGEKRIGHAGTLDPFATGLLIVAIGRQYTKRLEEFKNLDKEYVATIRLGAVSDTQDRTGTIINMKDTWNNIQPNDIETVLQSFVGAQEQIPPMYSAKKVDGKRLHALARAGKEVERKPSQIIIHSIGLTEHVPSSSREETKRNYNEDTLTIKVSCSPGTYIRTLAHDIGAALDVGAYCEELRRTKIGTYCVENGISPKELTPEIVEERLFE